MISSTSDWSSDREEKKKPMVSSTENCRFPINRLWRLPVLFGHPATG